MLPWPGLVIVVGRDDGPPPPALVMVRDCPLDGIDSTRRPENNPITSKSYSNNYKCHLGVAQDTLLSNAGLLAMQLLTAALDVMLGCRESFRMLVESVVRSSTLNRRLQRRDVRPLWLLEERERELLMSYHWWSGSLPLPLPLVLPRPAVLLLKVQADPAALGTLLLVTCQVRLADVQAAPQLVQVELLQAHGFALLHGRLSLQNKTKAS